MFLRIKYKFSLKLYAFEYNFGSLFIFSFPMKGKKIHKILQKRGRLYFRVCNFWPGCTKCQAEKKCRQEGIR